MNPLFEVLHEDADLLAVNKPAGLVCHPTKGDAYSSLISRVRLHLGPEARPHLVNRLDRETSGVVVVAKNEVAALALRKAWEQQTVRKEYWAIVHGTVAADGGTIDARLGRDEKSRVAIKDCVCATGAEAVTEFVVQRRLRKRAGEFTWLVVTPRTGRKHQIRIHLSHYGHPIVGDKLYGHDEDCYLALVEDRLTPEQRARLILPHHALHAREVKLMWQQRELIMRAEPEKWFVEFLADEADA